VIGTSLHVRIVAAADGVPRVTLARWKPARSHMPRERALRAEARRRQDAVAAAA
jgi:hypothetical protein